MQQHQQHRIGIQMHRLQPAVQIPFAQRPSQSHVEHAIGSDGRDFQGHQGPGNQAQQNQPQQHPSCRGNARGFWQGIDQTAGIVRWNCLEETAWVFRRELGETRRLRQESCLSAIDRTGHIAPRQCVRSNQPPPSLSATFDRFVIYIKVKPQDRPENPP